jgi:hypothetical protein
MFSLKSDEFGLIAQGCLILPFTRPSPQLFKLDECGIGIVRHLNINFRLHGTASGISGAGMFVSGVSFGLFEEPEYSVLGSDKTRRERHLTPLTLRTGLVDSRLQIGTSIPHGLAAPG